MTIKSKLWELISKYVRIKEKGICFTCGVRYWDEKLGQNDWRRMDAGHFLHGALDFNLMNIHCQCQKCNRRLSGNYEKYEAKMIVLYGKKPIEKMIRQSKQVFKPTDEWLKQEIIRIKSLLENEISKI